MRAWGLAVVLGSGTMLLASGVAKLRTATFPADLANYRLLPPAWVVPVATTVGWLEIAVGTALLLTPWPVPALLGALVLLAAFTAAITANLLRGRRIPCGCRGTTRPISWPLAATNSAWIVAAAWAAATSAPATTSLLGHDPRLSASQAWAVLWCAALAAVGVRLVTTAGQLHRALTQVAAGLPEASRP